MIKSIRQQVEEVVKKLPKSQPIFKAREFAADDAKDEISLKLIEDARDLVQSNFSDPFDKLVIKNAAERFNPNQVEYTWHCSSYDVLSEIVKSLLDVLRQHSGLKNPKSSKLFKWLCTVRSADNVNIGSQKTEGLLLLYKYGYKYSFNFTGADSIHAKNIIAILEKMRQKYER